MSINVIALAPPPRVSFRFVSPSAFHILFVFAIGYNSLAQGCCTARLSTSLHAFLITVCLLCQFQNFDNDTGGMSRLLSNSTLFKVIFGFLALGPILFDCAVKAREFSRVHSHGCECRNGCDYRNGCDCRNA